MKNENIKDIIAENRRSGEGNTAMRPGFHTNRQTKPLIVINLVAAVGDGCYTERDRGAVDELQTY